MKRYHVFYIYAYGNERKHEVFDHEDELLEFVRTAREDGDESPYRSMVVIYGEELEFEPREKVTAWRIATPQSG
jgi:hypothetical protein